jgi:RNA polymerase sporulation-specific sigma factor
MEIMTDEIQRLIEKAKKGDKYSQEKILESYAPLVKKVVRYYGIFLSKEDREDLFIEGLLALTRSINAYEESKGNFENLAFVTIRNAILDYLRKKHSEKPLDESYEDKFDIEEYIALKEAMKEFQETLSPLEKKVFSLYIEGHKMSEIAKIIGKDYKSCDNAIQRIKKRAVDFFK